MKNEKLWQWTMMDDAIQHRHISIHTREHFFKDFEFQIQFYLIVYHPINIKHYTAHRHDMVHVLAKFWENTAMRFRVTVRKLNVTDGQTYGGHFNISRAFGTAWDNKQTRSYHNKSILFKQTVVKLST